LKRVLAGCLGVVLITFATRSYTYLPTYLPTYQPTNQGSTTPEEYTGGRDADGIIKFVNEKTGLTRKIKKAPSAVVTLSPENFDSVVNGDKNVLVKFYAPWW
jgi:protein disulfide-isomerase A6